MNTSTPNNEPANSARFYASGNGSLTVEFGSVISAEFNQLAIELASSFASDPFPGFIEAVPAYASATIIYDVNEVRKWQPGLFAHRSVTSVASERLKQLKVTERASGRFHQVPVSFSLDDAPDLEDLARAKRLSTERVIEIFTSRSYRVYLLGYLPGFPYMGEVDEAISMPRRSTPRSFVPAGSVGIAGRQTGIYPLDSPGGWQIIGRTSVPLFSPHSETPCLFAPGDEIRFVAG